jgi:hypothetical protein
MQSKAAANFSYRQKFYLPIGVRDDKVIVLDKGSWNLGLTLRLFIPLRNWARLFFSGRKTQPSPYSFFSAGKREVLRGNSRFLPCPVSKSWYNRSRPLFVKGFSSLRRGCLVSQFSRRQRLEQIRCHGRRARNCLPGTVKLMEARP